MLFQTSLGIDIGTDQVSLVYLKKTFRDMTLVDYDTRPIEKEKSAEEKLNTVKEHVNGFIWKNRIVSADIFLGIPRELSILRFVDMPLSVKEGLASALNYEMEKYVPFSADEIYFDFQIISEDKESNSLKVLLVVVRKDIIDPFIDLVNQMGIEASGIEISSTAICNCFSPNLNIIGENNQYAVIYADHGRVELNLLVDGRLHYSKSVIRPENREDFYGLVLEELTLIKRNIGTEEIPLNVLFCDSGENGKIVNRFGEKEDIDIRTPDFSDMEIPSCSLVPAYGLALKGVSHNLSMDINLLPEKLRKKPSKWGHYTMLALSVLIVLLAIAWGGSEVVHQRLYLGRLNREIKRLAPEVTEFNRMQKRCEELETGINYLTSFRKKSLTVLDVLRELSLRLPESAWIRRLTFSEKDVNIEGEAESASKLIPALEASPLFCDVVFLSTITKGRAGKEYFRIGFKID